LYARVNDNETGLLFSTIAIDGNSISIGSGSDPSTPTFCSIFHIQSDDVDTSVDIEDLALGQTLSITGDVEHSTDLDPASVNGFTSSLKFTNADNAATIDTVQTIDTHSLPDDFTIETWFNITDTTTQTVAPQNLPANTTEYEASIDSNTQVVEWGDITGDETYATMQDYIDTIDLDRSMAVAPAGNYTACGTVTEYLANNDDTSTPDSYGDVNLSLNIGSNGNYINVGHCIESAKAITNTTSSYGEIHLIFNQEITVPDHGLEHAQLSILLNRHIVTGTTLAGVAVGIVLFQESADGSTGSYWHRGLGNQDGTFTIATSAIGHSSPYTEHNNNFYHGLPSNKTGVTNVCDLNNNFASAPTLDLSPGAKFKLGFYGANSGSGNPMTLYAARFTITYEPYLGTSVSSSTRKIFTLGDISAGYENNSLKYSIDGDTTVNDVASMITQDTWQHFAWTRYNDLNTLYIDGTNVAQFTNSNTHTGRFTLGSHKGYQGGHAGYMQDTRVLNDYAMYTGDTFTPPEQPLVTQNCEKYDTLTVPTVPTEVVRYDPSDTDGGVQTIRSMTTTEYDAIIPDDNTLYIINDTPDATQFNLPVSFEDDVHIKGNLRVDGNTYLSAGSSGTINVGDSDTDVVVFTADVASDIMLDTNMTYDLGSIEKHWLNIYTHDLWAHGDAQITGTLTSDEIQTTTLTADGDVRFKGNLIVDGEIEGVTTGSNNGSSTSDEIQTTTLTADGDVRIKGDLIVDGDITYEGAETYRFLDDVHIHGDLTVDGNVWFNANNTDATNSIFLGDANTDSIVFNANIKSDITPLDTSTYNLGNDTNTWSELHVDEIYIGGSPLSASTGVTQAANINSNGTISNQTNDWIQSVEVITWETLNGNPQDTASGHMYKITFSANYFTEVPAITVTPKHLINTAHVFAQYVSLDSTQCIVAFQKYDSTTTDAKQTDFCITAQSF
jgi:cytoskeletal protein CcmA (bactofilin family)